MEIQDVIPLLFALGVYFLYIKPVTGFNRYVKGLLLLVVALSTFFSYLYSIFKLTPAELGFSRFGSVALEDVFYTYNFICAFTVGRTILYLILKRYSALFEKYLSGRNTFTACLILGFSLFLSTAGCIGGMAEPEVVEYTIKTDRLPEDTKELIIIHLSDLHINATTPRNEVDEIVTRVNSLNPDLIAITGDFADGKVESVETVVSSLFSLKSKYGVYAVSGNHELYWGYHEWLSFLEKGGISFLENRSVIISDEKGDRLINLCGITDKKSEKYDIEPPDVEKALKDTDSSLPVIALSHRPKYGLEFKNHAEVTLSGHTHGGMMPGIDLIVSIFNGGMVHDIYEAGNSRIIVSRGTGINMAGPVRILNKPQIAVVRVSNTKY